MKDVRQAVDHARKLGKMFRGFLDVADALEEIGDLQQAARNAEQAVRKAREEATIATGELLETQQKISRELAAIKRAEATAEQIVLEARDDARVLVRDAEIGVKTLVDEAEHDAGVLRGQIKDDREAHALFMGDVERQHEKAQETLDAINVELRALREKIGA